MSVRSKIAVPALLAFSVIAISSPPTFAEDGVPPAPEVGARVTSLPSPPPEVVLPHDGPGIGLMHVCTGRTDAPHNSTHYPGYALVSAVTNCPGELVTVTVDLYVERVGSWVFLDRGSANGIGTIRNNARWKCPSGSTNTFKGIGYHTATGHTIGSSSYVNRFKCR